MGSGLKPIAGDLGLPIIGHSYEVVRDAAALARTKARQYAGRDVPCCLAVPAIHPGHDELENQPCTATPPPA
jgi:hypothetical protein